MKSIFKILGAALILFAATSVEVVASEAAVGNVNNVSGYSVPVVEINYDAMSLDELWDMGNAAYANNDFVGAEKGYKAILERGVHSADLYYNMGNLYHRLGRVGQSLLYLYKAQKLRPSDGDIAHNIEVVKLSTIDEIEELPTLFVKRWADWVATRFSALGWAIMSIVSLVLSLCFVLLFVFARGLRFRRLGLSLGALFALLFGIATYYGVESRGEILEPKEGVVLRKKASVMSGPDSSSTEIFVLHEGAKLSIEREYGDWCEIRIGDGKQGWIKLSAIGKI